MVPAAGILVYGTGSFLKHFQLADFAPNANILCTHFLATGTCVAVFIDVSS